MNSVVKKLLTVALVIAALVYTFFNYMNGKVTIIALGLVCIMLGYPMINIVASLIDDLKNR